MAERAAYIFAQVGEGDLDEMVQLRLDWSAANGQEPTPDFGERFRDWWARQTGHRVAWVARPAADVPAIAMANVMVFERMPRPGVADARWAYVGNMWVDAGHRRRGVGTALMTQVVDWCRTAGMERIVLNPSAMSVPMYQSLGFRPADDLMRLDL